MACTLTMGYTFKDPIDIKSGYTYHYRSLDTIRKVVYSVFKNESFILEDMQEHGDNHIERLNKMIEEYEREQRDKKINTILNDKNI